MPGETVRYTADDILLALEPHVWKRPSEIMMDMAGTKSSGQTEQRNAELPDWAWLISALGAMKDEGAVECRRGEDPGKVIESFVDFPVESMVEDFWRPGFKKEIGVKPTQFSEYRLTPSGLRRRQEIVESKQEKSRRAGVSGIPVCDSCELLNS